MTQLLQDLVTRARAIGAPVSVERGVDKNWFFRRRLHRSVVDGKMRLFLALGMIDGFRVLEVLPNELKFIASHDENGPIDIVELLHVPVHSSERATSTGMSNLRLLTTSGNNRSTFPRSCLKIYSIVERKYIYVIRMRSAILDVQANPNSSAFAIHLKGEIQIYGSKDYRFLFTISCFSSPAPGPTFSLGPAWLAFAGGLKTLHSRPMNRSKIPLAASLSFSKLSKDYKKTLSTLSKDVMSGLYSLGNIGKEKLADYLSNGPAESEKKEGESEGHAAGYLTIYDLPTRRTLCCIKAHSTAIAHVSFDSSGSLLVTAGSNGQYLHVWQLLNTDTNPSTCFTSCQPRLMYKIFRGITHAQIRNVSFSPDSRMIAISSQHGTTHIYSLNPSLQGNGSFPETPKLLDQGNTIKEAENIVTFTPFHRIRQPSAPPNSDPMPLVSAFHTFAGSLSLVVITGTQQVLVHSLSQGPEEGESRKWGLSVSKTWNLNTILQEASPSSPIESKESPAVKPPRQNKSNSLSQVEMNTYKSNEVPFWASPQFEMQSFKVRQQSVSGEGIDSKAEQGQPSPDHLFWEDYEFEPLQYRKHVSFSGLKHHDRGDGGTVHTKIVDAIVSPLLNGDSDAVQPHDMSNIVI
mmetsp:Transcript_3572/g.7184  ORF Transcript_3572/g.7184 Transcript_3572/m.7184 type:complete len:632 (-) Transcript_3572:309-2204(-)|eukprot:CAMPEP_0167797514 /NCGR_PEP_ID=MMETSP0111_2-20121227/15708_1 /TAXON_ID=91324 /ORGANISM="Lotharella globosa, Strain CCCM811" /LENGTH=631 /DNA_ID=CAMNT_0007691651 /DNA_START=36 /DNA_END=1931 /DNA_ORIENTATION=+